MGRKANPAAIEYDDADHGALEQGTQSLVVVSQNAAAVAEMIGYELAYDRERVIQIFNFHAGNAAESMLQMGRHLILLKENEPHGEFMEIVHERLGLNARTAQRMMQAAVKFMGLSPKANASTLTHLAKSKLFVLMNEDDMTLEALAEGGTLAGATLDDMQRMTHAELVAALRDLREESKAKDSVLAKKSELIDKLQTKQSRLKPPTPDEVGTQLRSELGARANEAEIVMRGLREGIGELLQHADEHAANYDDFLSGMLNQLALTINLIRGEFLIKAKADGDPTPEYKK